MIYIYDKTLLQFIKKPILKPLIKTVSLTLFILLFLGGSVLPPPTIKCEHETGYENVLLVGGGDQFSQDKLINLLNELNIKFPHIVMAQSMLETGNYTSKIFIENENLFGMKEAALRIHLAQGTQYNHAYYNSWRESVYDYAFYQATYLSDVKNERQYYKALDRSYAEAKNYSQILKVIVQENKLDSLFN